MWSFIIVCTLVSKMTYVICTCAHKCACIHLLSLSHTYTNAYTQCCIDNTVELAEILLEHGADLNARDIEGWTPLHAASATGNVQMINILIEEGASLVAINHDDSLPVDVAKDSDIKYILQQKMIEAGL